MAPRAHCGGDLGESYPDCGLPVRSVRALPPEPVAGEKQRAYGGSRAQASCVSGVAAVPRGAPGSHRDHRSEAGSNSFGPQVVQCEGRSFGWGPGGSRTTGVGDSPGEIVGARAPLALVLAKSEDFDSGGSAARRRWLRLLPPTRRAQDGGAVPQPHPRNPPPLLITRPVRRVPPLERQKDESVADPLSTRAGFRLPCPRSALTRQPEDELNAEDALGRCRRGKAEAASRARDADPSFDQLTPLPYR